MWNLEMNNDSPTQILEKARSRIANKNDWFGGGNPNKSNPFAICAYLAFLCK